ncbi:MAG: NAD(P)H-dependent oxidoreductase subunit E [Oscillospiraceae bacterium]|nr:NAD(P)H-dependent oxidoreductase subunit E [Oscillospiraceae bacterium]
MVKKVSKLPFQDTPEKARQLQAVIAQYRGDPSQLMTAMQKAQLIYGYLPYEVQVRIADGMDIPLERVYGVSTFYAQFALSPAGQYSVSVCLGTACYVKGAQAVLDRLTELLGIAPGECTEDGVFSLDACRCIGACGLAPVMMINDDVYGNLTPEQIAPILEKYRQA